MLGVTFNISGQKNLNERIEKSIDIYDLKIENEALINPTFTFHPKLLNKLISKEVDKYISSTNDISLEQYYAVLDNDDKSLLVGFGKKLNSGELIRLVFSGGLQLKGKADDKFYTFFNSDGFVENVGFKGKLTFFNHGIIYFNDGEKIKNKFLEYRNEEIYKAMIVEFNHPLFDTTNFNKKATDFIAAKELELIENQSDCKVESSDIYNYYIKMWSAADFYLPFTESENQTTLFSPDSLNKTNQFNNWSLSLSETMLFKTPKFSGTIAISGKVYNNNSILTESIKKKTFVKNNSVNQNQFNRIEEKAIFVGAYEEFVTPQIKGEIVLLPGNEFIGFSSAIEKNFGTYDQLNWKLGIPFNFKDDKGKPSVSFEIQWREVNKEHFIGISVGKSFGKYIG